MKKFLLAAASAAAFALSPAMADPETKGPHTADIKGCMMVLDCTDGVELLETVSQLQEQFPDYDWSPVGNEMEDILTSLETIGVPTFIADAKYFAYNERALYDVVNNRMFINKNNLKPWTFMSSFRHEGWHAMQDCMGGGLDNTFMAVIHGDESTPPMWTVMAERLYPSDIVEWEAEAKWAGAEENMTRDALQACVSSQQRPWTMIEPTPLTRSWLETKGYIK